MWCVFFMLWATVSAIQCPFSKVPQDEFTPFTTYHDVSDMHEQESSDQTNWPTSNLNVGRLVFQEYDNNPSAITEQLQFIDTVPRTDNIPDPSPSVTACYFYIRKFIRDPTDYPYEYGFFFGAINNLTFVYDNNTINVTTQEDPLPQKNFFTEIATYNPTPSGNGHNDICVAQKVNITNGYDWFNSSYFKPSYHAANLFYESIICICQSSNCTAPFAYYNMNETYENTRGLFGDFNESNSVWNDDIILMEHAFSASNITTTTTTTSTTTTDTSSTTSATSLTTSSTVVPPKPSEDDGMSTTDRGIIAGSVLGGVALLIVMTIVITTIVRSKPSSDTVALLSSWM